MQRIDIQSGLVVLFAVCLLSKIAFGEEGCGGGCGCGRSVVKIPQNAQVEIDGKQYGGRQRMLVPRKKGRRNKLVDELGDNAVVYMGNGPPQPEAIHMVLPANGRARGKKLKVKLQIRTQAENAIDYEPFRNKPSSKGEWYKNLGQIYQPYEIGCLDVRQNDLPLLFEDQTRRGNIKECMSHCIKTYNSYFAVGNKGQDCYCANNLDEEKKENLITYARDSDAVCSTRCEFHGNMAPCGGGRDAVSVYIMQSNNGNPVFSKLKYVVKGGNTKWWERLFFGIQN